MLWKASRPLTAVYCALHHLECRACNRRCSLNGGKLCNGKGECVSPGADLLRQAVPKMHG